MAFHWPNVLLSRNPQSQSTEGNGVDRYGTGGHVPQYLDREEHYQNQRWVTN